MITAWKISTPLRFWICFGLALASFIPAFPAQTLPFVHPIFTSDMVVQREVHFPVWGWTGPGTQVQVSFAGTTANATADSTGKWRVEFAPLAAGGPYSMAVSGPQSVTLTNVMVGDVWLCMGQSNMERDMTDANLLNAAAERADSINYPNIRHFKVKSDVSAGAVARTPQATLPTGSGPWKVASPSTTSGFSAVGYFLARSLNQHTGVAMGILNSTKGASRHSPWMSAEAAGQISDFTEEIYNLDTVTIDDLRTVCVRHNAMVAPLAGFPIRGIVWYQGESSTGLGDQYNDALPIMIADWRAKFGTNLPVVVVQISTYSTATTIPVKVWDANSIVREAQMRAAMADPHTAMVCTLDCGDSAASANIHPINKQDVGKRAARAMRQIAYGESIEGQGPLFSHATVEGSAIRCFFQNVGEGLMVGVKAPNDDTPVAGAPGGTAIFGFALTAKADATADADWQPASATIDPATNTVVVTSAAVPTPVHVRYAWAANPQNYASGNACNLFSKITNGNGTIVDGLPASPFRSDSKFWLRVNNGTGSTTLVLPKVPGSVIPISANPAPTGQEFVGWEGETAALANPAASSTTATASEVYTSLRAVYRFTSPPPALSAAIYGSEASLSWGTVSGARYTVYRSENGGTPIAVASMLTGTTFTDSSITPGGFYSYSVSADLPGSPGPVGTAATAAPFSVGGFSIDNGTAEIQFPTVAGKSYRVERSEDLAGWTTVADNIVGDGTPQSIADSPAPLPTRLFYRVVAD